MEEISYSMDHLWWDNSMIPFLPIGVLQQQIVGGNGGGVSFESLVAASNPVVWYDFQDTNFNAGTSLQDRSGNAHHLPRSGASNIGIDSAMTVTKSQSADMHTTSPGGHFWTDSADVINTAYVDLATALTMTFSYKHDDLSQGYSKILGSRYSNATTALAFFTQWPNGTGISTGSQTSDSGNREFVVATNDTDVHIFSARFLNGVVRGYKDGVFTSQQTHGVSTLWATASNFGIGGGMSGGGTGDFSIDHFHMNDFAMLEVDIIAMHDAFIAELV